MAKKIDVLLASWQHEHEYYKKILNLAKEGNRTYPASKFHGYEQLIAELKLKLYFETEAASNPSNLSLGSIQLYFRQSQVQNYFFKKNAIIEDGTDLGTIIKHNETVFQKYLPYTMDRLKKELIEKIKNNLLREFIIEIKNSCQQKQIGLDRGILADQSLFKISTSKDLLVNIRLNNRSTKRHIRQSRQEQGEQIYQEAYQRAWQFNNGTIALETQSISKNGARADKVEIFTNYGEISLMLVNFINKINAYSYNSADEDLFGDPIPCFPNKITDKEVANWIRGILDGNDLIELKDINENTVILDVSVKKPFYKFLHNLTYLLFGTETARNPASFVTNQMLLDLIIASKASWKEAFASDAKKNRYVGGIMPMSIGTQKSDAKKKLKGEPTASARTLHREYAPVLPWPYYYPGDPQNESGKINELIIREIDIVLKWLNEFHPGLTTLEEQALVIQKWAAERYGITTVARSDKTYENTI
jgi:hypothetical protein